jgi:pimeloyl-ACP methyl ester carboxylesterase
MSSTDESRSTAAGAVHQVMSAAGSVVSEAADGRWRRAGVIGLSLGVVAAGAAAGVAVERLTVGRDMRRRARAEVDAAAPFGSLRGVTYTVTAPDGTDLYVELDGTGWAGTPFAGRTGTTRTGADGDADADADAPRRGWLGGVLSGAVGSLLGRAPTPPLTVVFCHGYCLNQDSWHFQRAAFQDGLRLVFWDQRSHGRSERSRSHLAGEPASIDQLGGDLKAVIEAVAPTGPLVLVGHSMGGMTVMALADQHPELVRERVVGTAFLGTTSGNWSGSSLGLPAYSARMLHRVAPSVLKALGRQAELVERTRRLGSDLTSAIYRKYSFGMEQVDPAVERFAQRMLEATPIDVVAEFFPAFDLHEKVAALAAFRQIPVLVLAGTRDLLTPPVHSEAIAAELPDAELLVVEGAGHLVMLECPDLVNGRLAVLLERAAQACGAPLPQAVRELAEQSESTVKGT